MHLNVRKTFLPAIFVSFFLKIYIHTHIPSPKIYVCTLRNPKQILKVGKKNTEWYLPLVALFEKKPLNPSNTINYSFHEFGQSNAFEVYGNNSQTSFIVSKPIKVWLRSERWRDGLESFPKWCLFMQ